MLLPLTITLIQQGLLHKKYSAVELVNEYLSKINKNHNLNCFITVTDELAYQKAKKIDKIINNFGKSAIADYPLLGVAVSYKDVFLTKGVRTTAASKVLGSYLPVYSATVVNRLEKAGCIMLGKTNCDAWAHGASGENSDFGFSRNPWNKQYVPGGSSSGSAAAVAANLSLIATGTDTGGSVRLPANFCGVVGLKPTYGAVSRWGIIAMASSLDSVGHITRSSADSKKVFDVTKGQDYKDSTLKSPKLTKDNQMLKIGIPKEYFINGTDPQVLKAVNESINVFKKAGLEIIEISLPHTKYAVSVYYIIQSAEVSSNLGRYDGIRYGNDRSNFGQEAKRRIMLGTYVLSAGYFDKYYLKAMKVRTKIIQDFSEAFKSVDVILAPVSPTPPFKIGEKTRNPLQMYLADIFTVAANLAGIPALAIPCGFTKNFLPLGFQLMAPAFCEDNLFKLGSLYEKSVNWLPQVAN